MRFLFFTLISFMAIAFAKATVNDSIKILSYKYENNTLRYDVTYSGDNLLKIKTFLYTINWSQMLASDSIGVANGSDTVSFVLIPKPKLASGVKYNLSVDLFSPEGVKLKNHIITVSYTQIVNITHTTYYVSVGNGDDGNNGKSVNSAFKTLQTAANISSPGDTILVMNGTYVSKNAESLNVGVSGEVNNWITYKAYPGHTPKIKSIGSAWNAVFIDANYIVFDGFEMEGDLQNLKLADAEAAELEAENGGTDWYKYGIYNTNAICMGGNNSLGSHHIVIRNCKVHDFPGAGIASIRADYLTVENCIVYNNAWYMMYGGSGISFYHLFNSDKTTGYKNFVRNNYCYNNKTLVKWVDLKRLSDGNGIIIDDNRQVQANSLGTAYVGRTLVENNVCFNNGGSGIHAYSSNHVDIINNTAYGNGTVVGYADIFQGDAEDGKVMNNIMYARNGGKVNDNFNTKNVIYDYNIYYNGTIAINGPHDKVGDPMFVNLSTDGAVADFHVKPGSPAIDFGTSVFAAPTIVPVIDISGTVRPQGSAIDVGAYESPYKASSSKCYLVTPSANESFKDGSDITLAANAITDNGTISKVEFYQGAVKLGESTSFPYTYVWGNVPAGEYTITAQAFDSKNVPIVSEGILVRVASSAPIEKLVNNDFNNGLNNWALNAWNGATGTIEIDSTSVLNGKYSILASMTALGQNDYEAQLRQPVSLVKGRKYVLTFSAKASVTRSMNVWIQMNGSPYTMYFNQSASLTTAAKDFNYTFTATTTDADCSLEYILGNTIASTWIDNISLTEVDNSTKPECAIASPVMSATFDNPASITIDATATVTGSTIKRVEFFADTTFLGTVTATPYSLNWIGLRNGKFLLTVRAYDAKGNFATSSIVAISISNLVGIQSVAGNVLRVYPNPVANYLTIQCPEAEKLKMLTISNMNGQIVLNSFLTKKVDVSKLKSGIYVARINTSLGVYTVKLVKE